MHFRLSKLIPDSYSKRSISCVLQRFYFVNSFGEKRERKRNHTYTQTHTVCYFSCCPCSFLYHFNHNLLMLHTIATKQRCRTVSLNKSSKRRQFQRKIMTCSRSRKLIVSMINIFTRLSFFSFFFFFVIQTKRRKQGEEKN